MLKQNKNRGAGLVTVVVVLAVSSVLLSASIWLSFQHYKNVMVDESTEEVRAELDLCAELIALSMNSDSTLDSVCAHGSLLSSFYSLDETDISNIVGDDESILGKTISFQEYTFHLLPQGEKLKEGIIIQYYRGNTLILQETYHFDVVGGKYRIAYPTPDVPEQTTAEGGVSK